MRNFKTDRKPSRGRDSGRGGFGRERGGFNRNRGGGNFRSDRSDGPREMFSAVCDECGKDCKIPFKPSTDKPIYCSDCFERVDNRSDRRDSRNSRDDRRSSRRSFESNQSWDRSYQNERSSNNNDVEFQNEVREEFEQINAKLEKIMKLLGPVKVRIGEIEEEITEDIFSKKEESPE